MDLNLKHCDATLTGLSTNSFKAYIVLHTSVKLCMILLMNDKFQRVSTDRLNTKFALIFKLCTEHAKFRNLGTQHRLKPVKAEADACRSGLDFPFHYPQSRLSPNVRMTQ